MKTITRLAAAFIFCGGLSFGMVVQYHGKLLDANCYNQNGASRRVNGERMVVTCAPTASTSEFAIRTNGKVRMFDTAGNQKAATAIQDGLVKPSKDHDVDVAIYGTRHGNTIKVETIRNHKSETAVH